jgi:hypothetical protein
MNQPSRTVCSLFVIGLGLVLGVSSLAYAADETYWAFRSVSRPDPPSLKAKDAAPIRNPIDSFIAQGLEENGIKPAPEADRRTLIRRVTFDLIGLPPTPEEIDAFLQDDRPDAYERVIDRLLASPHYGERWGRHWLDLVRYGETHGYERDDPKPDAWKYRDWVVRALNRDTPYDQFVTAQLAGDEMPGASADSKIATGMLRVGLVDDEPADPVMDRFDQLDDLVKTVGTTMLGLTVHCARCHDHKFDPITQKDYYKLLSFFTPARRFKRGDLDSIELDLATDAERKLYQERVARFEERLRPLREKLESIREPVAKRLEAERLAALDNDTLAALQTPENRRDSEQKSLARKAKAKLKVKPDDVSARLSGDEKKRLAELERAIAEVEADRPAPLPRALAVTDDGPSSPATHLLIRGDAHSPGAEVSPGFLSAIDSETPKITPPEGGKTTGRRLALARWIVSPRNPLTYRVIVNRLWQHHFGKGIVASPSDFGVMGEEPSEPELLDWLASELISNGGRLKPIHRLIVTSSTYRRSLEWNEASNEKDPENSLWWRRPPLRLEAEAIRDSILAVSGAINLEIGGPSVTPPIAPEVLARQSRPGSGWGPSDEKSAARRSIYVHVKRSLPLPELEVLDAPDTSEPCPRRAVTTTAPQALTLLNSAFLHEQARRFAERLTREVGDDQAAQVERGFRLALARSPNETELRDSLSFLDEQAALIRRRPKPEDRSAARFEALRAFCLVLLNCNEFSTVD